MFPQLNSTCSDIPENTRHTLSFPRLLKQNGRLEYKRCTVCTRLVTIRSDWSTAVQQEFGIKKNKKKLQ